jgi:RsiW-degrading membrane proteinase PrsW (M82 family)
MFEWLAWVGAVPALLAMYVVDRADARRPEPRSTLRRVALAGALSVVPAALLELYLLKLGPQHGLLAALYVAFVVAAPVGELSKGLCVRWFVWNRPEFDERTDGIVYGTRAGLGFALLENVGYLLLTKSMLGFTWMFVVRALLTVPMHAITGGLLGHYAAWRRFEGRGPGMSGGLLLAIALHGTFDAGLLVSATLIQEKDFVVALVAPSIPWQSSSAASSRSDAPGEWLFPLTTARNSEEARQRKRCRRESPRRPCPTSDRRDMTLARQRESPPFWWRPPSWCLPGVWSCMWPNVNGQPSAVAATRTISPIAPPSAKDETH